MPLSDSVITKINWYFGLYVQKKAAEGRTFFGKVTAFASSAASIAVSVIPHTNIKVSNSSSNKDIGDVIRHRINQKPNDEEWIKIIEELGVAATEVQNSTLVKTSECCEILNVVRRYILDEIQKNCRENPQDSLAIALKNKIIETEAYLEMLENNAYDFKVANKSMETVLQNEKAIVHTKLVLACLGNNYHLLRSDLATIHKLFPPANVGYNFEYANTEKIYGLPVITTLPLVMQNFVELFHTKYPHLEKRVEAPANPLPQAPKFSAPQAEEIKVHPDDETKPGIPVAAQQVSDGVILSLLPKIEVQAAPESPLSEHKSHIPAESASQKPTEADISNALDILNLHGKARKTRRKTLEASPEEVFAVLNPVIPARS